MRAMSQTDQKIKSAYNDIIRSRVYFGDADPAAASLWTTDPIILFNKGQQEVTKNATTGADVSLRECDTSLFGSNGLIPNAQSFDVMGIAIDIHMANVQCNVPFSDDAITQIDVNPVQTPNPYPFVDQIRSQGTFSLWRNSTEWLEQGNVADYPCGLYNSGWGSDGANDGVALSATSGFIICQNGMTFRKLSVWQHLASLDQFQGKFQMCRPLLLTGSGFVGYIDFLLVGRANVDRTSTQFLASY